MLDQCRGQWTSVVPALPIIVGDIPYLVLWSSPLVWCIFRKSLGTSSTSFLGVLWTAIYAPGIEKNQQCTTTQHILQNKYTCSFITYHTYGSEVAWNYVQPMSIKPQSVNSMKNVTKHIKIKFYISQIEMISQPSNPVKACVPKNKLSTVYYFQEKNRPHSDLWN